MGHGVWSVGLALHTSCPFFMPHAPCSRPTALALPANSMSDSCSLIIYSITPPYFVLILYILTCTKHVRNMYELRTNYGLSINKTIPSRLRGWKQSVGPAEAISGGIMNASHKNPCSEITRFTKLDKKAPPFISIAGPKIDFKGGRDNQVKGNFYPLKMKQVYRS